MEREELKIVRRLLASGGSARNTSSQERLLALIADIANVNSASATRDVTPAAQQARPAVTAVDPLATLSRLAGAELSRRQTQIVTPEAEARQENATGGGGSAAGTVLKTIGLATGVGPLVAGLMTVFGGKGRGKPEQVALPVFAPPPSINVAAGLNSDRSISAVEYGAGDQLRPVAAEPTGSATTIQINVQAMDSRSFLDHSADIAAAVRRAMLQSSSLNDVVSEL